MGRPTIKDLAREAGLSASTVNRVLAGAGGVRPVTIRRIEAAASAIGFYGLGALQHRAAAARPRLRLGVLLHQPHRTFYRNIARALGDAATSEPSAEIDLRVEFLEDLAPHVIAERALALGEGCDAFALVAPVHPLVLDAVERLTAGGVPVFGLITQLAATGQVHYVGLDNWKVGRTAGWAVHHIAQAPGRVGILVANHRYRNQEMNEQGFRSYFREHAPDFTLLEPLSTFESSAVAQEMTERLLAENPDLAALYISGGGITGAVAALRASGRAGDLVVVGYELMDLTRAALLDGTLNFLISHPLDRLARELIGGMCSAASTPGQAGTITRILPFEIHVRENL